nr:MAG TPA: hypothetical protein [Caudoviricetes sp.]
MRVFLVLIFVGPQQVRLQWLELKINGKGLNIL